jgi:hypothetical protein
MKEYPGKFFKFNEEKIGPALRLPDSRGFYSHINISPEAGGIGV